MLEYNFANANFENDEVLGYIDDIIADQEIKFDNSSLVLGVVETTKDITANYSLICMQSLTADQIIVRNDLICYQDIVCNRLEVDGDLKCFGNVKVREIFIRGMGIVNSAYILQGKVEGNLVGVESIEIETELNVDNMVCMEGVMGSGKLVCNNIYANDYIEIDVESNPTNVAMPVSKEAVKEQKVQEAENSYEQILKERESYIKIKQDELIVKESIHELVEYLDVLRKCDNIFEEDYQICKFIREIEDMGVISELSTYLTLVNYKNIAKEYLFKAIPVQYRFGQFLNKQRSNLHNMQTSNLCAHEMLIETLHLYEQNKESFYKSEQDIILAKLYETIGIKSKLVEINLKTRR